MSSATSTSPSPRAPASSAVFDVDVVDEAPGFCCLAVRGPGAARLKDTEPGGHRFQRVPPHDKRGRVHTSTVTVAVLDDAVDDDDAFAERDVDVDYYKGGGAGGQHRNKTLSCVRLVHRPTGIEARGASERSQHQNKALALAVLAARVRAAAKDAVDDDRAGERRRQVGSGQRGDKVRTIRTQDGLVVCERTGKKHRLRDYVRGDFDWLLS